MEETPRPRQDGEDATLADPRFGPANDLNTGEHLVVETDYPRSPLAPVAHPDGAIDLMEGQRASDGIAGARDALLDWVRRDPAAALGAALALGFAVGFVLRRTVFLSTWEMGEMGETRRWRR